LICFKVERQTLSSFRVSEPQVAKELDSWAIWDERM
jgi:hypothetical protein